MDFDFDAGFDIDYSFLDHEDFGLAKSFSSAPIGIIDPAASLKDREEPNVEKECE
jgi:hypothetical protein